VEEELLVSTVSTSSVHGNITTAPTEIEVTGGAMDATMVASVDPYLKQLAVIETVIQPPHLLDESVFYDWKSKTS
jgi:hypothetical protein